MFNVHYSLRRTNIFSVSCDIAFMLLPYDLSYDKSSNDLIQSGNNHYPMKFWWSFIKPHRIARPSLSRRDIIAPLLCKISLYDNCVCDKICLHHHIYTKLYVFVRDMLYLWSIISLCLWWDFNIVVNEVCGFALSLAKNTRYKVMIVFKS